MCVYNTYVHQYTCEGELYLDTEVYLEMALFHSHLRTCMNKHSVWVYVSTCIRSNTILLTADQTIRYVHLRIYKLTQHAVGFYELRHPLSKLCQHNMQI